jgi:hypothetical protein
VADERFLQRWSRLKTQGEPPPAGVAVPVEATETKEDALPPTPTPTLGDVAALTHDSDYSAFLGTGVDTTVRRLAMKKLFSDPHFNVMDGLDIYMGDYNKPDPVSPAMLAALQHAQRFMQDVLETDGEAVTDTKKAGEPDDRS